MLNISVKVDGKYLSVNDKNLTPSIDNATNIETKNDVQILLVSWNPTDCNIHPPPTINTFKHKQSLSRGSFVKNLESYPPIVSRFCAITKNNVILVL